MSVGSANPTDAAVRSVAGAMLLEQTIRYEYSAPVHDLRQRLVVVPPPWHGAQVRRGWGIEILGVERSTVRSRTDGFGNHVIRVAAPVVTEAVTFSVWSEVDTAADVAAPAAIEDSRWLRPTRLTVADDRIRRLVAELGGARDAATMSAVTRASLEYEWGVTSVATAAGEAVAGGRGVCQDFAHVMLALCRAIGVPARYVSGHLLGEGGSHAWVEVLVEDDGATTARFEAWDPTHDRRTDRSYVTVAVGRDYGDVAPMSGTYVGQASSRLTVRKRATAVETGMGQQQLAV